MISNGPWPTLLWDWDGTIADTVPHIVSAHHRATETLLGHRLDEVAIRARIGEPARRRIGALVGAAHAHDVFRLYSAHMQSIDARDTPLFAGVVQIVAEADANRITNVIVTSRPRSQVISVLEHHRIQQHFRGVVGLEETRLHKPSPEPLLRGALLAESEPVDCAYIGDAVVDMQAATAAGMVGIAVSWGAAGADALAASTPRRVVTSVTELRDSVIDSRIPQEDSRTA